MALQRPLRLFQLPTPLRTTITHASAAATSSCNQCRSLHALNKPAPKIPQPIPFVPDVPTFLTLIGRDMIKHEAKIPSWEALFTLDSQQLKDSGLEPPRARRYLLWWRERFRHGVYGLGGDVKHATRVGDQVAAELRIVEVPAKGQEHAKGTLTRDAGYQQVVSNTPAEFLVMDLGEGGKKRSILDRLAPPPKVERSEVHAVKGVEIVRPNTIGGTGVEYLKGCQGVAVLKARGGLWEQKRGVKGDGGERRKAEVRAKRAAAERKNAR